MNILSCTLRFDTDSDSIAPKWWPFFSVVAYFLAPIPSLLIPKEDNTFSETPSVFKHIAMFLTGALIISGFGVPLVLAHVEIIDPRAMALALSGGLVVYGTIIAYLHFYHKKDDDDEN